MFRDGWGPRRVVGEFELPDLEDLVHEREAVPSLRAIVAQLPDPRARRGQRHLWTALVLLVIVGLLCGANTQQALARWGHTTGWARLRRLGLVRRGGSSQPTVHRLSRDVDVEQLEAVLGGWLQQVRTAGCGTHISPRRASHATGGSTQWPCCGRRPMPQARGPSGWWNGPRRRPRHGASAGLRSANGSATGAATGWGWPGPGVTRSPRTRLPD